VSDPAPRSPGRHSAADDAAYWYDLLAEDPTPQPEEARGPFEPMQSSHGTTGPPEPEERQPQDEQTRERKLEQLKDLYLTAEAIGEENVDKHFDLLLAQQRELISDYFRKSAAAGQDQGAEAQPVNKQPDGPTTPPEGVSVRAEPPRAW
jgi:hypothetical protein